MDVETMAAEYLVWDPWSSSPLPITNMLKPSRMIMWGAKWHGKSRVMQMDERAGVKAMFKGIRDLIAEADMTVGYNTDRFDHLWINGGIVEHRLPALPPVASLDLYKTIKKLRYQSSKLAYVAPLLEIGEKVKNAGMELWMGVRAGDEKAWRDMARYNRGDVTLLDSGYNRLRPYITNHPRLFPKMKDKAICGACGSENTHIYPGKYRAAQTIYNRFLCRDCGKWDKVVHKEAR